MKLYEALQGNLKSQISNKPRANPFYTSVIQDKLCYIRDVTKSKKTSLCEFVYVTPFKILGQTANKMHREGGERPYCILKNCKRSVTRLIFVMHILWYFADSV